MKVKVGFSVQEAQAWNSSRASQIILKLLIVSIVTLKLVNWLA